MIMAARWLTRKRTTSACSSGLIHRPRGTWRAIWALNSGLVLDSVKGVRVAPGQTTLTLTPKSASSKARCLLKPTTPHLVAV